MLPLEQIIARARKVRLLLVDCDGVLTDGSLYLTTLDDEVYEATKVFHVHDGHGVRLAHDAGLKIGVISGRSSAALAARAAELQITLLYQGVADKLEVYEQIKLLEGLSDEQIAYIGDDLPDLTVLSRAGLAVAVQDAVEEIRELVHFITKKPGGRGAVRETIELILKAQANG
ncbi:MAG: HAD hydrolase family protein [Acidobacteria bacterium]|nr:HAD hydrolase family protein [Acidobacteriota bacterium]